MTDFDELEGKIRSLDNGTALLFIMVGLTCALLMVLHRNQNVRLDALEAACTVEQVEVER